MTGPITIEFKAIDARIVKEMLEQVAGYCQRPVSEDLLVSSLSAELSIKIGKRLAEHRPKFKMNLQPSEATNLVLAYNRFLAKEKKRVPEFWQMTIDPISFKIQQFYA